MQDYCSYIIFGATLYCMRCRPALSQGVVAASISRTSECNSRSDKALDDIYSDDGAKRL